MTTPNGTLAEQFGALLGAERERQGKTLRQLADELGVANPTLHIYEHGQANPTLAKVEELAEQYGLVVTIKATRAPGSRPSDTPVG